MSEQGCCGAGETEKECCKRAVERHKAAAEKKEAERQQRERLSDKLYQLRSYFWLCVWLGGFGPVVFFFGTKPDSWWLALASLFLWVIAWSVRKDIQKLKSEMAIAISARK